MFGCAIALGIRAALDPTSNIVHKVLIMAFSLPSAGENARDEPLLCH
jgi:hypothetical protein